MKTFERQQTEHVQLVLNFDQARVLAKRATALAIERAGQRFAVEIAEEDYATLDTLDRICELVAARNPDAC